MAKNLRNIKRTFEIVVSVEIEEKDDSLVLSCMDEQAVKSENIVAFQGEYKKKEDCSESYNEVPELSEGDLENAVIEVVSQGAGRVARRKMEKGGQGDEPVFLS